MAMPSTANTSRKSSPGARCWQRRQVDGMELSHSFTVPASIEQTWQTFMDLQEVGGCFPGATVTEVTDDGFSGTVKVKLGPISLLYAGSGAFVERDDTAHRAVIEAKGKDKRGNGTAGATVKMELF